MKNDLLCSQYFLYGIIAKILTYVYAISFSEGQKYPGVAPGYFLCDMTPHGCDTRGKKCQTGRIPGAKNAFGVTFPAKKGINVTFLHWQE